MHSTNYQNSFIAVSPDCAAMVGTVPERSGTIAAMQYGRVAGAPYKVTSDELLFGIFADRREMFGDVRDEAMQVFFSKGQPCMRASPLVKTYGWGVHYDAVGRMALIGVESEKYQELLADKSIEQFVGMRSKRKG